jgi:hypothetical protein
MRSTRSSAEGQRLATFGSNLWHPVGVRRFLPFLVALTLVGTAVAAPRTQGLRLVSTTPFVVAGSGFASAARVSVVLVTPGGVSDRRAVRASRAGTFRVDFGTVALSRCERPVVRATTAGGGGTVLKWPPLPACKSVRTP